jgi:hypothetical protein
MLSLTVAIVVLRSHILRYGLEASDFAISVQRCGTLHRLSNLLPSTDDGAKGVSDGHVVLMREQLLCRLGVSLIELTPGLERGSHELGPGELRADPRTALLASPT